MVERNRRNNLIANFSVTKDQCSDLQLKLHPTRHPTKNAFFRRGKELEKNYDPTGIGNGLKQRSGLRD